MKILKNNKGIAIIEFLFMFYMFFFVLVLIYGSWGVVHSSVLNSIGARAYAFRNIRHRSNLLFLKDNTEKYTEFFENVYWKKGSRFFASIEKNPEHFVARKLRVDVGGQNWSDPDQEGSIGLKESTRPRDVQLYKTTWQGLDDMLKIDVKNKDFGIKKVHLEIGYGICLNAGCMPER